LQGPIVSAGGLQSATSEYTTPYNIFTLSNTYNGSTFYGIKYVEGNPDTIQFIGANNIGLSVGMDTGITIANASLRAPIFYDSDNTGTYLNPNGSSIISSGSSYPMEFRTTQRYISRFWNTAVSGNGFWLANDANALVFHADSVGDKAYLDSSGNFISYGSLRAPLFYDYNDTSYYLDPASYSRIRLLTLTQARVDSSKFPVGHYGSGQEVFALDPTWTTDQLREYFNSNNVSWVADSTAPGGYAIQISGSTSVGGVYGSGFPYIPVETDDTFYMECYVKDVSGTNTHYMGSMDFNQNFSSLGGNPGSFGYWVMANSGPGTGWTKYSGYISGFGTATGTFVSGTKYWTPQALFNYTGGGTSYISGWRVYKLAKGIVGRFPNSTVNNGEAWYGRANDRNRGSFTVQLGGGSSSGRQFEVVDYAWSSVMFGVHSDNYAFAANSFRAPIFYDSGDTSYYWNPNTSNAHRFQTPSGYIDIGPMNSSWCHFQTDRSNFYFGSRTHHDGGISAYDGNDYAYFPTYYDFNDTAYYLDPRGASVLSGLKLNGVDNNASGSDYILWINKPNNNDWAIGISGQYDYNITYDGAASHSYGVRGLKGGSEYWRVGTDLLYHNASVRAPIFYDTDNTGYYVDPSSTTYINTLTAAGNITANSDVRLKRDIVKIDNAIEKVKKLNGVTFTRIDVEDTTKRYAGLIAQEVLEVLPEAVEGTATYSVAYGNMVGLLVEAIKEQQSEIDELKALVKQLLAK